MSIVSYSYPHAALVGNPSDVYFGKTIAFVFSNFRAEVALWESPELVILPNDRDKIIFASLEELVEDIDLTGYYGGIRLLKAAIKRFYECCQDESIVLDRRNFTCVTTRQFHAVSVWSVRVRLSRRVCAGLCSFKKLLSQNRSW
jgi:glucuronokinase